MKMKKITIENFKSVGNEQIEIDLDFNASKLLIGKNGAGKTTMFDAIVWCIYGYTKLKADNVVNKKVKSGTKVELEFSENGKRYVITRYRKHPVHDNNVYIFEDGENITLKNQTDNQELIQRIIGMDSRAFLSSIVLSSENYKQFLRETNSVRLQIFESVFSLRDINEYSKINRNKLKEIQDEYSKNESNISSITSYINSDVDALKAYKENYRNTIANLDLQIDSHKKNIESYERVLNENKDIDFDEETTKAIEFQTALNNYKIQKNNVNSIKFSLDSQISRKNEIENKINELRNVLSEYTVDELRNEISKNTVMESKKKEISEMEKEISNKETEIRMIGSDISRLTEVCIDRKSKLESIEKEYEKISSRRCPTCGHELEEEKANLLKSEIEESRKSANKLLLEAANEINDKKTKKQKLESEISIYKSEIDRALSEIEEPKLSLQEIKFKVSEINKAKELIPSLESELSKIESGIETTKETLSAMNIESEPKYDGMTLDELNRLRNKITDIVSAINSEKTSIESMENIKKTAFDSNYVSKTVTAINERKEILGELNSNSVRLRKEIAKHKILDDKFSNGEKGFKKYFINKTINLFNEKVNTFLPFFFDDDITIKFDKDLNDEITFRGEPTDFQELSSGEKTRCELCIVFSLYFMVQSLFGCGTNLLVIDEILDRGLDDIGITASKRILDDISRNTSVFVVTHRDDLKMMFDNIVTVYKDGDGFTKIKAG